MVLLMTEEGSKRGRDSASQGPATKSGLTKAICSGQEPQPLDLLPKSDFKGTVLERAECRPGFAF